MSLSNALYFLFCFSLSMEGGNVAGNGAAGKGNGAGGNIPRKQLVISVYNK